MGLHPPQELKLLVRNGYNHVLHHQSICVIDAEVLQLGLVLTRVRGARWGEPRGKDWKEIGSCMAMTSMRVSRFVTD